MSSVEQHRAEAPHRVRAAVITISDTRTKDNDTSGKKIVDLLQSAGHEITTWEIIPDDPDRIRTLIADLTRSPAHLLIRSSPASHSAFPIPHSPFPPDAILLTGGTGIGSRDQTFETIAPLLKKTLPGFGEIFRMLSYEEIGAAAMLSRAIGGSIGSTVVLAMPGSTPAVRLAMEKLILPEIAHLVREARR
jgi:molybdenum cofactor biosynthesis protein B